MTTTQDSTEDWLETETSKVFWAGLGIGAADDIEDNEKDKAIINVKKHYVKEAKAKIRQHMLSEALELIGEDENDHVENWDCSCGANHSLHHTYSRENRLRAELRQQFNKQWGKK